MGSNDPHMIVTVEDITAQIERRSEAEAIDEERRRIAQEIHDGVAQDLATIRLKLCLWLQRMCLPGQDYHSLPTLIHQGAHPHPGPMPSCTGRQLPEPGR